jgi:nucleoprotein TPR
MNGTSVPVPKPAEGKNEAPAASATTQPSNIPTAPNGTASVPASNILGVSQVSANQISLAHISQAPQTNAGAGQRSSSIPMMRGNASMRGRGGSQIYQPRGGQQGGRGRGGAQQQQQQQQRGALNAGAATFSPTGPAGGKRPREEGPMGPQGHVVKRPRGGGQN